MHPQQTIPCVILSGGKSRRFGSNKALAAIKEIRVIDRLIGRLKAQTRGPIVINASSSDEYELCEHQFIADVILGDIGPLAGILTALAWAKENDFSHVATTPVDTPLLPTDFIPRMVANGFPSIAACEGRAHPLHGVWPVRSVTVLRRALENGIRAARDWAVICGARQCLFPKQSGFDPFFNINTPEDIAKLSGA